MSVPYIGSTITLISKAEIRYEGKLVQIDQQNSTVTLQGVRSFGSEGRRGGVNEIAASDQDLQVTNLQPTAPAPQAAPQDPAIVSSKKKEEKPPQQQQLPNEQRDQSRDNQQRGDESRGRGKTRGGRGRGGKSRGIVVPDTDFDFQNQNEKLNKEEIAKEVSQQATDAENISNQLEKLTMANFYDKKSSFFDNISCESKEKLEGQERQKPREDRKLNIETFGVAGNFRGRGRGGYRGNRRGRGRGRGGYQQQQQNVQQ